MGFKPGDWVRHPKRPEWGVGQVLDMHQGVVRVHFEPDVERRFREEVLELASPGSNAVHSTGPTPEYAAELKRLVSNFLSIANHPAIYGIEPKILDAFLGSGRGKSEVRTQLRRWVNTPRFGRHDHAQPAARELWNFLFPQERH